MDEIVRERHLLAPLKKRANLVIDTTHHTSGEFRALIDRNFRRADTLGLMVSLISFFLSIRSAPRGRLGFDVRFLAN